ncbi:MAG: hypothetical protein ABSE49_15150 [Polyangiaceae bacterium]
MTRETREQLLWRKLVDEAGEELIEEAAAVSVAQAEKELAEAGFDVAAERAKAEAFLASLEGVAAAEGEAAAEAVPQEPPESLPERPAKRPSRKARPAVVWAATAAAAAVAAGTAVTAYVTTSGPGVSTRTPPPPPSTAGPVENPPSDLAIAAELRRRAATALTMGHADECLALLDAAAVKDPPGDATPEVQELRKRAAAAEKKK